MKPRISVFGYAVAVLGLLTQSASANSEKDDVVNLAKQNISETALIESGKLYGRGLMDPVTSTATVTSFTCVENGLSSFDDGTDTLTSTVTSTYCSSNTYSSLTDHPTSTTVSFGEFLFSLLFRSGESSFPGGLPLRTEPPPLFSHLELFCSSSFNTFSFL